MSLAHRSAHAAAWAANSGDQPCSAADWAADAAERSAFFDVRAVSTPTNLSNVYDVPASARKVTASRAVRPAALVDRDVACTAAPGRSVETTAPVVPSVCVANFTSTASELPGTAPAPVGSSRRAPAPSITPTTVAEPLPPGGRVRGT